MTAKVIYKGNLRTEATHLRSGSMIETDAPVDNKGKGERFSPTDLVATALATCIVTTIGIAAEGHNMDLLGMTCEAEKIMASNPRRIAEIKISITFPNGQVYNDQQKRLMQHIAETCPVGLSLHPDTKQTVSFSWN